MNRWRRDLADWWLVGVLAIAAVGLAIYAGTDARRVAGAAAAALAGGTATRVVDVLRSRRDQAERDRRQELQGIDECRRLMTALGTDDLAAATVLNALLHHHRALLTDEDVATLEWWEKLGFRTTWPDDRVGPTFKRIQERMAERERELDK